MLAAMKKELTLEIVNHDNNNDYDESAGQSLIESPLRDHQR